MRCETVRELLDDLEAERLVPALRADVTDHLAGCEGCSSAQALGRKVATLLSDVPAPAVPAGFEERVARELAARGRRSWLAAVGAFVGETWPDALRHGVIAAASAAVAVVLYAQAFPPSFEDDKDVPVETEARTVANTVTDGSESRVCNVTDTREGLAVAKGDDVEVTLSVLTPEPMGGARVRVVLPPGLAFSPSSHPELEGKRVMTLTPDIGEGETAFTFTVRGEEEGRWDVTALVEDDDESVLLAGTTIDVGPEPDEEMP
jgi:hypothetical protein